MNKTPETDKIIRNAKIADHPPTRLAATLTVKCEKLERERDEARDAIRVLAEHGESEIQRITKERDEAREALREIWQSGDAFLPHVDKATTNRWRKAAGWEETK
jgi:ketopantoate reductase